MISFWQMGKHFALDSILYKRRERVELSSNDHSHIMNATEWLMIETAAML